MGTKNYDFTYIDEPCHQKRDLVPETSRFLDEIDTALKVVAESGGGYTESEIKDFANDALDTRLEGDGVMAFNFDSTSGVLLVDNVSAEGEMLHTTEIDIGDYVMGKGYQTEEQVTSIVQQQLGVVEDGEY